MRIGLFAHRLAQRQPTGIGRYLAELVRALSGAAGADDTLLLASTREAEIASWPLPRVETRVVPWPRRAVQAGWCLGAGPRLERSLGSLDVAHLIQPFPPVKTAAPQVVTVHDLFPFEHPDWYRRSEQWTYRRSIDLVVRRARRIVVPSAYVADRVVSLLDIDPARVTAVPLGVSGAFGHARTEQDVVATCQRFGLMPQGFAVCVGAVSTRKNVVALVRAAAELRDERIALVMIGPDGHGAETVDTAIARLDGSARVIRTGYLPDLETAALVQGAAVLLHPTLGEGFGFVPLEAMAAGTPVIAARVGAVPEVVGDAAVLIDEPTRPSAWASAVTELMGDTGRRAALAAAGEQRAGAFSWALTARTMIDIYHDAARS
jgi:glycosyltransferase involved in cell wall biosynthesis